MEITRTPSLMTRALLDIDHAACRLHDGAPDEAADIATGAFDALPGSYRHGLTRTRALSVYRSLPSATPGRAALADALRAA
ncbi:hypothetical protein JFN87_08085 [Streptomyces bomunensis]|uniref:Uncharacterized protein n=1 Tax=Streptomyces montanisoli TaxID=2798581 RepID=A0A940MF13_9ACTN|nr:hypothetical protein [Streptomyces montanisoli]